MANDLAKNAEKCLVDIDGIKVETYKTDWCSCNELGVEVGTTGHKGGDTGHGGRTYMRISDVSCTDMRCRIRGVYYDDNGSHHEEIRFVHVNDLKIIFGGDSELDTFFEAVQFAANVLGEYTGGVMEYELSKLEIRQMAFAAYLNELCERYRRTGSLKGMSEIQRKHHVTPVTKQQFFECDLHHAAGYIDSDFCNKVYAYILDTTKATPTPKYDNHQK